jgi:hypothetical protein
MRGILKSIYIRYSTKLINYVIYIFFILVLQVLNLQIDHVSNQPLDSALQISKSKLTI